MSLVCVCETVAGSYLNKWTSGLKADEQNAGDARMVHRAWYMPIAYCLLQSTWCSRVWQGECLSSFFNKWTKMAAGSHAGGPHQQWQCLFCIFLEKAVWGSIWTHSGEKSKGPHARRPRTSRDTDVILRFISVIAFTIFTTFNHFTSFSCVTNFTCQSIPTSLDVLAKSI